MLEIIVNLLLSENCVFLCPTWCVVEIETEELWCLHHTEKIVLCVEYRNTILNNVLCCFDGTHQLKHNIEWRRKIQYYVWLLNSWLFNTACWESRSQVLCCCLDGIVFYLWCWYCCLLCRGCCRVMRFSGVFLLLMISVFVNILTAMEAFLL